MLRQAVKTQDFSNNAVKNCLSATPPSISAQDYIFIRHLVWCRAIATESQRGIDASRFENMWLGCDSTFIFCKCLLSLCLAIYTAVGGYSPFQTPYYINAGQNSASSDVLLASA